MSTPWLNDVQPFPLENGLLNPPIDANNFMQMNPGPAPFDYDSIQNQQRMQNGSNGSPALQNVYQTQSIVGTKRPRPQEDSIGASPGQAPGMLPPSRSQTPQQGAYSGFQTAVNGSQNFQAPNPYHRFSNAGSNASLSPSMQNQPYNSQGQPPRVQTVSPSPFSPGAQNFGSQASPPPQSEHASRVNTPHNVPVNYMQGMPYGGPANQPFTPPPNSNGVSSQPPQNLQQQQQQQQQRMHEMRQRQFYQQQMQANNAAMQNRYPGMGPNPSMNPSGQMPGMVAGGGRMQHPQQPASRPIPYDQLVRNIAPWMQARGLPFNPHPTVLGRPINLMHLFQLVMKFGGPGGSRAVTARGYWPTIAQQLHIPPAQLVVAANELQSYWQSNLMQYEITYLQSQQQRQRAMQDQARLQRPPQNGEAPSAQDMYSPMNPRNAHLQDAGPIQAIPAQTPTQNGFATPLSRTDHQQPDARAVQPNGYSSSLEARRPSVQNRQTPQIPNQSYTSPPQPDRLHIQATTVAKRAKPKDQGENGYPRRPVSPRRERYSPTVEDFADNPDLERYGGLHIGAVKQLGDEVAALRPTMPLLQELGVIDIQALTLSLRSGIKGEMRLALDIFCALSVQMDLDLSKCGDLVDALVECAEEQVDFLAENAAEVSDDMLMDSYEDMLRAWRMESLAFQMPPEFGSLEYDLDRAVDRLICITTTLRNFSSHEKNWELLGTSAVIPLMANVMRYLGTRNMLLRSYKNTLDFAKDAVAYLGNVSLSVKLPGKEDALCVLHFLLSFAPSPSPVIGSDNKVMFTSYDPSLHTHLPTAVDCLAKLLARDEPNRGFFRSILSADNASSPPFELLTKAFGFAIAVLPRNEIDEQRLNQIVQVRAPCLAQALLAAETLAALIPASEHSLARTWLTSEDGFAAYLIKTVVYLGEHFPVRPPHNPRQPPNPRLQEAEDISAIVSHRGLGLLRKLAEKAKDVEPDGTRFPLGILPSKESLRSNLLTGQFESGLLRQLYSYATLET
ncbi:MAG: hypothetical protein L6R38_000123 [Xanthoria sp. 2 TBL-2021]|nr:MAG: hypothetical protein L6R38_000123 [Xanthoria sp. 2 TBL-2021]